jgi:hypothetical protein
VSAIADPFDAVARPGLPKVYRGLEGEAVKWRRDWRLRSPQPRGLKGRVQKAKTRLKTILRVLRHSRKSA